MIFFSPSLFRPLFTHPPALSEKKKEATIKEVSCIENCEIFPHLDFFISYEGQIEGKKND